MTRKILLALFIMLCTALASPGTAETRYYVDCNVTGTLRNGASWGTAFKSISDALKVAGLGSYIWVKTGVYHEPPLAINTLLWLYGGFRGTEGSITDRVPGAFPTVIDADQQGSVITIAAGQFCTIDGFTLRNGYSMYGGGVYCKGGGPTNAIKITNCRITGCTATAAGGGVYFGAYTSTGTDSTGAFTIVDNNTAPEGGGVVIDYHSGAILNNWLIVRNHATDKGGGFYAPFHCDGSLRSCTLAYNQADVSAGGAYINYGGNVQFSNCIVAFNSAPDQGGLGGGGGANSLTYTYCDVYGNSGGDYGGNILPPSSYIGNFSADPLFIMPEKDEFHLQASSPCTTAGPYAVETPYPIDRIGVAKLLADGTAVKLAGKFVSCVDGATTYVQEPDRATAIPVTGLSGCVPGTVIKSVSGAIGTGTEGAKCLNAASFVLQSGSPYTIRPLGATVSSLGRLTGLIARTWGKVTAPASGGFMMTDGNASVRITGGTAAVDSFVVVTGVYTLNGTFAAQSVLPM